MVKVRLNFWARWTIYNYVAHLYFDIKRGVKKVIQPSCFIFKPVVPSEKKMQKLTLSNCSHVCPKSKSVIGIVHSTCKLQQIVNVDNLKSENNPLTLSLGASICVTPFMKTCNFHHSATDIIKFQDLYLQACWMLMLPRCHCVIWGHSNQVRADFSSGVQAETGISNPESLFYFWLCLIDNSIILVLKNHLSDLLDEMPWRWSGR